MINREKVIKGLECYRMNPDPAHCEKKDCPYNNNDTYYGYWCCSNSILYDAVRLLKEQEPVKPETARSGGGTTWWNVCGACKTAINPNDKYCHECGVAIDWGRDSEPYYPEVPCISSWNAELAFKGWLEYCKREKRRAVDDRTDN